MFDTMKASLKEFKVQLKQKWAKYTHEGHKSESAKGRTTQTQYSMKNARRDPSLE